MVNGMIEIAPGVEFNTIAREWRCKWSDENGGASLIAAQKLLDEMKGEILDVTHDWYGKQLSTHEVMNGKLNVGQQLTQRVINEEMKTLKIITKLPAGEFGEWEKKGFAPEEKFLGRLKEIEGITDVETQTYTLMNVPLAGKIKVPKATSGCMAGSLPTVG
mmetsp:Transcript_97911/g.277513  ORF Transcript_97911/g.277513 Transcript_97911/m.277513 type:complete len:161 (+) Transcript_97911:91-573(+)